MKFLWWMMFGYRYLFISFWTNFLNGLCSWSKYYKARRPHILLQHCPLPLLQHHPLLALLSSVYHEPLHSCVHCVHPPLSSLGIFPAAGSWLARDIIVHCVVYSVCPSVCCTDCLSSITTQNQFVPSARLSTVLSCLCFVIQWSGFKYWRFQTEEKLRSISSGFSGWLRGMLAAFTILNTLGDFVACWLMTLG